MKIKTILLFIFLISLHINAQDFKSPVEYLSFIGKEQDAISKSMWKYTLAVAHSKNPRKIDNTRKQLVKSIQASSAKITTLKEGYKGDVDYKIAVLTFLNVAEKNINEEYDKIIDMQEVAEQSYDAMEAYFMTRDLVTKKMDAEYEKLQLAQKQFAAKYNINLTGDMSELGKKMKISDEVFDYHTQLYLIFFKCNITDAQLANAIQKGDLGVIQQNGNALVQYAKEGLDKLKTIKPFDKDNSMVIATNKALEAYKKEGEVYIPKVVDFLMFNEKFENAKKTLDNKSEKDRTKEEVDDFNKMVKETNKRIDDYNKSSNANTQELNNAIQSWNATGDNFISTHVPTE